MEMILRAHGMPLSGDIVDTTLRRLSAATDRLRKHIRTIRVHIEDQNGMKGGMDKVCVIIADLKDSGTVVVKEQRGSILAATTRAAHRIGPAIQARLDRRTTCRRIISKPNPNPNPNPNPQTGDSAKLANYF